MTDSVRPSVRPVEPWRQRLIRSLLYGRNVDRAAKARARVGFAILAFAAIYAVIGGRLGMFPVRADGHRARRAAGQRATAPPPAPISRPQARKTPPGVQGPKVVRRP